MRLFGHDTSPYVRRVRALLHELDLTYERDLAGWMEPSEALLKANPIAKVPAMTVRENDRDLTLLDSRTIADFLLTRRGVQASAKPAAPPFQATMFHAKHRYEDETALTLIDTALDSEIQIFLFGRDGITPETAPYLKRQATRVSRCLTTVDAMYAGRTTLHDGAFGYVDLALYCSLDWFIFRKRSDVSGHRNLAAFSAAHRERASMTATDPRTAADHMAAKK